MSSFSRFQIGATILLLGSAEAKSHPRVPKFTALRKVVKAHAARHMAKIPRARARRVEGMRKANKQGGDTEFDDLFGFNPFEDGEGFNPENLGGSAGQQECYCPDKGGAAHGGAGGNRRQEDGDHNTPLCPNCHQGQTFVTAELGCDEALKVISRHCEPLLPLLENADNSASVLGTVCEQDSRAFKECTKAIGKLVDRGTECKLIETVQGFFDTVQSTCAQAEHTECADTEFLTTSQALEEQCEGFFDFFELFEKMEDANTTATDLNAADEKLQTVCESDCFVKADELLEGQYAKCADKKMLHLIKRVGRSVCEKKADSEERCGKEVLEVVVGGETGDVTPETFCGGCINDFGNSFQELLNDVAADSADDRDFESFAGEIRETFAEVQEGEQAICAQVDGEYCGAVLEQLKVEEVDLDLLFEENGNVTYAQADALATELCGNKTTRKCVQKLFGGGIRDRKNRAKHDFKQCAVYQDSESCLKSNCFVAFERELQYIAREKEMLDFLCIKNTEENPEYCLAMMKEVENQRDECFEALFQEGECTCGDSVYSQQQLQNVSDALHEVLKYVPAVSSSDNTDGWWFFSVFKNMTEGEFQALQQFVNSENDRDGGRRQDVTILDFVPQAIQDFLEDDDLKTLASELEGNDDLMMHLKKLLEMLPNLDFFKNVGWIQEELPSEQAGECTVPTDGPCSCTSKGTCNASCDEWAVNLTTRMGCCLYHVSRVVVDHEHRAYDVDGIPPVEIVDTVNNDVTEVQLEGDETKTELSWEHNPLLPFTQCASLNTSAFQTKVQTRCQTVTNPPKLKMRLALKWDDIKGNAALIGRIVASLIEDVAQMISVSSSHITGTLSEDDGSETRRQTENVGGTQFDFEIIGGANQEAVDDAAVDFSALDSETLAKSLTQTNLELAESCTECLRNIGGTTVVSIGDEANETIGTETGSGSGSSSSVGVPIVTAICAVIAFVVA